MPFAQRIKNKIKVAFAPCDIKLIDESHKHAGHAGARPEGETHFFLTVISDTFQGMNRVQRHQAIYGVLAEELKEHVHALRIKSHTFDEVE